MSLPGDLSFAVFAMVSLDFILGAAALLLAAAAGVALTLMLRGLLRSYLKHRGTRLVTCPETGNCEAVRLDAIYAAATGLFGPAEVNLKTCTRWPERQDCPQQCLQQIELSPNECRLTAMMASWYGARECACCERPFEKVHPFDQQPGLLTPNGKILDWQDIPASRIPAVLRTHRPLCWDCMIAESFRSRHPSPIDAN